MRVVFLNCLFVSAILVAPLSIVLPIVPRVALLNVETVERPGIKKLSVFTKGVFQRVVDVWAYQQSGIWSLFVKAQNSINYHIFNLASEKYSNETLMGNQNVLFDRVYVNDLNGTYLSETPDPNKFAEQVLKFQNLLESQGRQFLLIIHPSKTVMNPDWVPDSFRVGNPNPRMIEVLEPALKAAGVNYVKVSESFADNSVRYWPKSGAHLNSLGKCLSAKALLEFFRSKNLSNLPDINCQYSAGKLVASTREDLDLVRLINAWKTNSSISNVPEVKIEPIDKPADQQKPSALFVGTSYTFGLLRALRKANAFSETDFLFYDKSHYFTKNIGEKNELRGKQNFNKSLHSKEFILSHDLVVLESTEARLHQLGFGILSNSQPVKHQKKKKKARK